MSRPPQTQTLPTSVCPILLVVQEALAQLREYPTFHIVSSFYAFAHHSLSCASIRLLQVLYNENGGPQDCSNQSWVEVLRAMRYNLDAKGYSQVPQLSSSRMIDVNAPMTIVNHPSGTKRAVLIGINYVGQNGELSVRPILADQQQ